MSPDEVSEALRSSIQETRQRAPSPPQQVKEEYNDDYETAYRQQAANSNFRGHSPVREVKFLIKFYSWGFI